VRKTSLLFPVHLLTILLLVIGLAGCANRQTPAAATAAPTQPPASTEDDYPVPPTLAPVESYPIGTPTEAPVMEATEPSGTGTGPAVVQVRENRSRISARLIERSTDPDNAANALLRVEILSSESIENMPNFTENLINQEVDLLTDAANLPEIQPGTNFTAEVSYHGDERGGKYFAQQIEPVEP